MRIVKELWAATGGNNVWKYSLISKHMNITVSNYGCSLLSWYVPDKYGIPGNIVLGYPTFDEYLDDRLYMGSVIGRVAGRISGASFNMEGQTFNLSPNDTGTGNHLHGGYAGLSKKLYDIIDETSANDHALLRFHCHCAHLEEGYPGNIDVYISFELTADRTLTITYEAFTDMATHFNPSNHSYFNLSSSPKPATDQLLFIHADQFVAADKTYIPTGELRPVAKTVQDFRQTRPINQWGASYNECYVLNQTPNEYGCHAMMHEPSSGRTMKVSTSFPGIVLYTGDFLKHPFTPMQGVCLETQFFPDSPNCPEFPSTILRPAQKFHQSTSYTFV